jgi:hypothetical protein
MAYWQEKQEEETELRAVTFDFETLSWFASELPAFLNQPAID